jgi:predicted metalloprotease with PDZ domain
VLTILATLATLAGALVPAVLAAGPERTVISLADPELDAQESAILTEQCGVPVSASNAGHVIYQVFPGGPRSITELDHYNIRATYTNLATGTSVRLRDIGPDRFYIRDGKAYLGVTGRSTTFSGVIGLVVFDLETGEIVKSAGNEVGIFWDSICEALGA